MILNHEETDGDGAPVIDGAKAKEFYKRTLDAVEAALTEVFEGWRELRP